MEKIFPCSRIFTPEGHYQRKKYLGYLWDRWAQRKLDECVEPSPLRYLESTLFAAAGREGGARGLGW